VEAKGQQRQSGRKLILGDITPRRRGPHGGRKGKARAKVYAPRRILGFCRGGGGGGNSLTSRPHLGEALGNLKKVGGKKRRKVTTRSYGRSTAAIIPFIADLEGGSAVQGVNIGTWAVEHSKRTG